MRKLEFYTGYNKKEYTFPQLVGADIEFLLMPPVSLAEGDKENEFNFIKSTGTISFGFVTELNQKVIILYNG